MRSLTAAQQSRTASAQPTGTPSSDQSSTVRWTGMEAKQGGHGTPGGKMTSHLRRLSRRPIAAARGSRTSRYLARSCTSPQAIGRTLGGSPGTPPGLANGTKLAPNNQARTDAGAEPKRGRTSAMVPASCVAGTDMASIKWPGEMPLRPAAEPRPKRWTAPRTWTAVKAGPLTVAGGGLSMGGARACKFSRAARVASEASATPPAERAATARAYQPRKASAAAAAARRGGTGSCSGSPGATRGRTAGRGGSATRGWPTPVVGTGPA
jgi:hypothetical protein